MIADLRRRLWACLALTIPIAALSTEVQRSFGLETRLHFTGDQYVLFVLASVVYLWGGKPFLEGLAGEVHTRRIGMMTLIGVAITVAYAYSSATVFGLAGTAFFLELATLVDVMLLGHWIEMRSVSRASRSLEEMARLLPSKAHRVDLDGTVVDVDLPRLDVRDTVIVKPGERIPADGSVVHGLTTVDESLLTGESIPVVKGIDSTVIGGSLNGEGSITVRVEKTGAESFISQVIELVREAQASKSQTQALADRAASWLTAVALGGGTLTFVAWLLVGPPAIGSGRVAFALERAVTVMVIACPHALGLAVPLVIAVSTALAAQHGLLVRDRSAFERARAIDAVVFDKTGTLTEGRFGVTEVVVVDDDRGKDELLALAASVEARSEHPLAKAIALSTNLIMPVEDFRAIPGQGAQATVDGWRVAVVSPGYLAEHGILASDVRISELEQAGNTVVFVVVDGTLAGAIGLADIVRPESHEAVAQLHAAGIRTMMLTGDDRRVAARVASEIGLDEFFAEVRPKDKAARIKEIQAEGLTVAMTGDGINDAPALAQADVGIAIGAGTDVAVETADIVLVRDDPRAVASIIELSRATYSKMIQNLVWATGYNVVAIPLAAGVLAAWGILLSPALGAVFMSASTVIVAINARLLRMPA